jgi:uroporphyrinogen-III synthase
VPEGSRASLAGKRVVVTRSAQQSTPLVKALQEVGAIPIALPLLAFAAPEDGTGLDAALRQAQGFDWLLLTSQNAVIALQERCATLQISLRAIFAKVRVAAVGPATAAACESAGLKVSYLSSRRQGVALAEELGAELTGKKVLLPRSDLASAELPEVLRRLGAVLTDVVAYRTIPGGDGARQVELLLSDSPDTILFFSPSSVHHLQELLGQDDFLELAKRAIFAAIGPVTQEALRGAGVQRIVVAADATVDATVKALSEYFSKAAAESSHAGVRKG